MLNQSITEENKNIGGDASQSAIQERHVITPITHRMDDTVRDYEDDDEGIN